MHKVARLREHRIDWGLKKYRTVAAHLGVASSEILLPGDEPTYECTVQPGGSTPKLDRIQPRDQAVAATIVADVCAGMIEGALGFAG